MLKRTNRAVKSNKNYIMYGIISEALSNFIQYYQSLDQFDLLYQQCLWL